MSEIDWQTISDFKWLFTGRADAYGDDAGFCVHEPLTIMHWRKHLEGHAPLGIYNVIDVAITVSGRFTGENTFMCKWGAIDIDYDDLQEAWNVHDLLKSVGVNSWVERSRSKGYHVWVFVEDWISAKTMRRALLVVRDFLKLKAKEVYPKQEELTAEKPYGNWLRLPYNGWLTLSRGSYTHRVMLCRYPSPGFVPLADFLSSADLYADPTKLELLAARYEEPKRQATGFIPSHQAMDIHKAKTALHRLSIPLLWHIVCNGPTEGHDRSGTLMRIANLAAKNGATPEECFAIVAYSDGQEWCQKYGPRPDGEYRMYEIVERVYSTLDSD